MALVNGYGSVAPYGHNYYKGDSPKPTEFVGLTTQLIEQFGTVQINTFGYNFEPYVRPVYITQSTEVGKSPADSVLQQFSQAMVN